MDTKRRLLLLGANRGVPYSEYLALCALFNQTNGYAWTNKTGWLSGKSVATWYGVTVANGHVATLLLTNNNLVGALDCSILNALPYLTTISLGTNPSLTGDISKYTIQSPLTQLYFYSTGLTGDISTWTLPASLTHLYVWASPVSGDISAWSIPPGFQQLHLQYSNVSGDIGGFVFPDYMQYLYTYATALDVNSQWVNFPANIRGFRCDGCGLTQTQVDYVIASMYAKRAAMTYATPSAAVGGTNAAPSGVYADEDPPTTGKGMIYELINDPEAEGFNKWAITYTA